MKKNKSPTMLGVGFALLTWSTLGFSQDEEAAPPPETPETRAEEASTAAEPPPAAETEAPPGEEVPPAPAEQPAVAAEPVVEEPAEESAPAVAVAVDEAAPVAAPEDEPAPFTPEFTVGVGMRTGLEIGLTGPREGQLSLNDGLVDQIHIRPYMSGSLTKNIGFFTQFEVGTPNGLGSFAILDAIAQIKLLDEVQLWVGQHIPANDRNNMNGPFFGNTWNFAIAVEEYPFDVGARDRGATLWGLIAGGHLKYHLSLVDLQPGRDIGEARGAGRITVHFWEPENFYYNSGTYFGKQDILTLGAVFQGQAGDEGEDNGLIGFSFDGMMEKNFGKGGTLTLEAGYWNYENTGAGYVVNQDTVDEGLGVAGPYPGSAYMGVVSWLTPGKVGPGQIQPNFRVQYADWDVEERLVLDAGLAYVVDGFNHKYHINYRHYETDPAMGDKVTGDSIQIGVQYLMGL